MTPKEREFHRKMAARCFNRAWDLLDKKERSKDDDLQMLNLSHSSLFHWELVGSPKNRAVGEWQLSRVYAELGEPHLALLFAKSCLTTCKHNHLSEILPTAEEAMARAYAAANDSRNARRYLKSARMQLSRLPIDEDERKIYLGQIEETEKLIRG